MFGFGQQSNQCAPVMKDVKDRWDRDKEKDAQEALKLWIQFEKDLSKLHPVGEQLIENMLRGKLNQRY